MKDKLTVAMIGCGRFCRSFVPLFKAHHIVEKVYVCDIIRERAEEYAKLFDVEIIDSFEAALADDKINAVAIFTPRHTHGGLVIRALEAGKNVYSAVPCSISVEEIFRIEELVRKTHLTYSMGETGFYRAASCFVRTEYEKGTFGKFVYGEAQYNHDIRNMEMSFRSSGGEDWKKFAGFPPFFYPTHSTSMVLSAMPNAHGKTVVALGYEGSPRTDIFARGDVNNYGNPFSNTSMLIELDNGGIVRINENRCIGWKAPETYISQFVGSDGGYEFSVARHSLAYWDTTRLDSRGLPTATVMKDVTKECQPPELYELIETDYQKAIQAIADGKGFTSASPAQPTNRLPVEFENLRNGHNGTHHFMIDDFCRAYETGKLSPTNIWTAARFNLPGLMAHKSALEHGKPQDVPDLGNPPEDWEVLPWNK